MEALLQMRALESDADDPFWGNARRRVNPRNRVAISKRVYDSFPLALGFILLPGALPSGMSTSKGLFSWLTFRDDQVDLLHLAILKLPY